MRINIRAHFRGELDSAKYSTEHYYIDVQVKVGYVEDVVDRRSSKHRLGSKRAITKRSQQVRGQTTKSRNYPSEGWVRQGRC